MVYLSCAWSVRTQQQPTFVKAQGGLRPSHPTPPHPPVGAAPPPCVAQMHKEETFHLYIFFNFGFFKIRRLEVGWPLSVSVSEACCCCDVMYPPRDISYCNVINVKLRPGRIRRPPDVAEHQRRGRWLSSTRSFFSFYIFHDSKTGQQGTGQSI